MLRWRAWAKAVACSVILLAGLAVLSLTSCGQGGSLEGLPQGQFPTVNADPFPGLPELPGGELDFELSHQTSAVNEQQGSECSDHGPAATIQDTDLLMASSSAQFAWGLYTWGKFPAQDKPIAVKVDLAAGSDSSGTYVLLSNYTTGRWQIYGPMTGESQSFSYAGNKSYLSDNRNTYVVVVQSYGTTATLDKISLSTTTDLDPPAPPTGLTVDEVLPRQVTLSWDANTESDLEGYNVYRWTSDERADPDQSKYIINDDVVLETTYVDDTAEEQQHYFYWLSSQDATGNVSRPSDAVTADTPEDLPPAAPTNLTVSDVRGKRATLNWDAVADADLKGYDVWLGPHEDFEMFEGTRVTALPVPDLTYIVRDLLKDHDYWARVQAVDQGNNRSALSNTVDWHTLANLPPTADFSVPDYIERTVPVTFDPRTTSDGDDDLEDLQFSWDYDGDMTVDQTTSGPVLVNHQYNIRGPYSVTLTVDDGEFSDSITKTIFISSKVNYWNGPPATGRVVTLRGGDATPDGRMLALYHDSDANNFAVYNDGSGNWQTIPVGANGSFASSAVLTPAGFAVLSYVQTGSFVSYSLDSWSAGLWTNLGLVDGQPLKIKAPPFDSDLACSSDGKFSFVISGIGEKIDRHSDYVVGCFLQEDSGDFSLYEPFDSGDFNTEMALNSKVSTVRDSSSAWFMLMDRPLSNGLLLVQMHAGNNTHDLSYYPAPAAALTACQLAFGDGDTSKLHWAWSSAAQPNRINYGDNWGTANDPAQFFDASGSLLSVAALGGGLDNQLRCIYASRDADDTEHLRSLDTSAASDEEIRSGLARIGEARGGAVWGAGGATGFAACEEYCDSEIIGATIVNNAMTQETTLYQPSLPDYLGNISAPVCFDDGTLLCLFEQHYPTALSLEFSDYTHAPIFGYRGYDNYLDPMTAVSLPGSHSYLVGSITPRNNAVLTRFGDNVAVTGNHIQTLNGATRISLLRHRSTDEILAVFSGGNGGANMYASHWNGNSFDAPVQIYSGASEIERFGLADNPMGGWGVAFIDSAKAIRTVETSGLSWGAAQLQDGGASGVNPKCGAGIAYSPTGDLVLGAERQGANPGFYCGLRPPVGSVTWEKVSNSSGENGVGCACFYHLGIPMMTYYYAEAGVNAYSRLRIAEKHSGQWFDIEQFGELQGIPFGYALDAQGRIIFTGYSLAYEPTQAITYILTP